ncbi:MAG: class I SAM-dependent methyltransferase [Propionibacteriaceae bacterium]
MSDLRDYQEWHRQYDDPTSGISWRLRTVQDYIRGALDTAFLTDRASLEGASLDGAVLGGDPGSFRILSLCAGDGRDVIDVLAERPDADRIAATLVELHPEIAQQARDRASQAGLRHVEVRTANAGTVDLFADVIPVQLLLLVGIFGNISDDDIHRTIAAAPQLCAPGATVLWSRGRSKIDFNDQVRAWFAEAGFTELDYAPLDTGSRPAAGAMRYDGPPQPLVAGQQLFTFIR